MAHGLSLIVVQAAAERRALAQERSSAEASRAVLEAVEKAGREALARLPAAAGAVAPSGRGAVPASPAQPAPPRPGGRRRPGQRARRERILDPETLAALSAGLDLTAYRIVQECLTNVVKHAGARRVRIDVHRTARDLEVDVQDDGSGSGQGLPEGGHGLTGMRERVAMYGGSLQAGPTEAGPGSGCTPGSPSPVR